VGHSGGTGSMLESGPVPDSLGAVEMSGPGSFQRPR
jgi:hypothetical protein